MIYRKMTIKDYDRVYDLWMHTPGMGLNATDDSREGIQKYLNRNPNTCFVAEDGERIVGVILSGNDGRRGFIHHTAVAVDMRKQGIGARLVEHAMEALKGEGIHKTALVAFSENTLGNTFWEHQGFTTREDLIYRNKNINPLVKIIT